MATKATEDEVVRTINVYKTTDYDKFDWVQGNRGRHKAHVASLTRAMEKDGNYLIKHPIEVDEHFRIYDGQHSFTAAKNLGKPIYYQFATEATLDDIRKQNSNRRNWNWHDYATSFAEGNHNESYQQFLQLYEDFGERFGVLARYTTGAISNHGKPSAGTFLRTFIDGDFVMPDYERTQKLLGQYQELCDAGKVHNGQFASACYKLMTNTGYNHELMKRKLSLNKRSLISIFLESDYYFTLQDIARS